MLDIIMMTPRVLVHEKMSYLIPIHIGRKTVSQQIVNKQASTWSGPGKNIYSRSNVCSHDHIDGWFGRNSSGTDQGYNNRCGRT